MLINCFLSSFRYMLEEHSMTDQLLSRLCIQMLIFSQMRRITNNDWLGATHLH